MIVHGLVNDPEGGNPKLAYDKGYSFCNCRNIFFTDIKNLRYDVYDEAYIKKYDYELTRNIARFECRKIFGILNAHKIVPKSMLEVGSIEDTVLTYASDKGIASTGLDINRKDSKYQFINANFEHFITDKKYDLIWASHVFEHFHDPIAQLKKCKAMLNEGGAIYIAMPDTFFIDFGNIMQWDWAVEEHYILWGMESFIELCNELGFKCIYSEHGTDLFPKGNGGLFWKQDFKVILQ